VEWNTLSEHPRFGRVFAYDLFRLLATPIGQDLAPRCRQLFNDWPPDMACLQTLYIAISKSINRSGFLKKPKRKGRDQKLKVNATCELACVADGNFSVKRPYIER